MVAFTIPFPNRVEEHLYVLGGHFIHSDSQCASCSIQYDQAKALASLTLANLSANFCHPTASNTQLSLKFIENMMQRAQICCHDLKKWIVH